MWSLEPESFPPPTQASTSPNWLDKAIEHTDNTLDKLVERMQKQGLAGSGTVHLHLLRALYANMSYQTYARNDNINEMVWLGAVLGHGTTGQLGIDTAKYYAFIKVKLDTLTTPALRSDPYQQTLAKNFEKLRQDLYSQAILAPILAMDLVQYVRQQAAEIEEALQKVRDIQ